MKKLKIITGKIGAGKTTYLQNLITSIPFVEGVIQPKIKKNRFFQDIKSNELIKITSNVETNSTFRIGQFIFNSDSFIWAKKKLQNSLQSLPQTIVIDEYGPLEINGKGLEPVVSEIIEFINNSENIDLIIVIREALVDEFLQKYHLEMSEVEIIRIEN